MQASFREMSAAVISEMLLDFVILPRQFFRSSELAVRPIFVAVAVPKILQPDFLGKFTRIPGPRPVFEGYFGSEFKVRLAYAKVLLPELLNRILPFERVNDSELESTLRGLFRESEDEE